MVAAGLIRSESIVTTFKGGNGTDIEAGEDDNNIDQKSDEHLTKRTKDTAIKKWKFFCFLRTLDPKVELAARQERIAEKVDDWMRHMVMRMQIVEEHKDLGDNPPESLGYSVAEIFTDNIWNNNKNLNPATLVPNVNVEMEEETEQSKHLKQQEERIAAREQAAWENERQLIIDGKIKIGREHLRRQDPILILHQEKTEMKRKAVKELRLSKSFNPSRNYYKLSDEFSADVGKNNVSSSFPPHICSNEIDDGLETMVAHFDYGEVKDELKLGANNFHEEYAQHSRTEENGNDLFNAENICYKELKRRNPVFSVLDDAKDVDDMFRIGELCVNPIPYWFWNILELVNVG